MFTTLFWNKLATGFDEILCGKAKLLGKANCQLCGRFAYSPTSRMGSKLNFVTFGHFVPQNSEFKSEPDT